MRPRAPIRAALTALGSGAAALVASFALAQGVPPWVPSGRLPLPEDARSVEILRRDEPLFVEPSTTAQRRGAAARDARLPLFGVRSGQGCRADFILVGPQAWVCGDHVRVSSQAPSASDAEPPRAADGLPRDYYFVGKDGALAYRDLDLAENTAPSGELQPGFAVSVTRVEKGGPSGELFGLTTKGLWLPLRDLTRVVPLAFEGVRVKDGRLDRGWVVTESAKTYGEPTGKKVEGSRRRFDLVTATEFHEQKDRTLVRVGEGSWMDSRDVRFPSSSAPPAEARAGERWIDVDLASEVLVAYEGTTPQFATLISTGIGTGDAPTATPAGVHRVWVKLQTTDMTNLEEPEAEHYYAMEEVPWVMFFKKGFGLHGAFWHRSFGRPRSHGCVNLAPRDARWLFDWAGPHLPTGWTAVLPTDYDPGTLVRVR